MADRRRGRDEEQDRGTKAEHGIAREDEGMDDRGTKAELGGADDPNWLKDSKAELGGADDPTWLKDPKAELGGAGPESQGVERPIWQESRPTERASMPDTDPAGIDVGPVFKGRADEGDPAAVVWPDYKEWPESIDAETEDADWADGPEMEADIDMDVEDEDEEEHAR